MVLGLLAIAAIPTVTGVWIAAHNQDQCSRSDDELMRKFNLQCYCTPNSPSARRINNGRVILRDSKLYIIPPSEEIHGHPLECFYIAYPDPDRPKPAPIGLVSTISNDPPVLNWVYVNKKTREMKYGNRTQSRAHIVGSWGWESGEEGGPGGLALEGVEGAIAVLGEDGAWEVRWEDGNVSGGLVGREVLRVSLDRKMLEPTTEDEEDSQNDETKNETTIELKTKSVRRHEEFAGQPDTEVEASTGNRKRKRRRRRNWHSPRFEMISTTAERPLKNI